MALDAPGSNPSASPVAPPCLAHSGVETRLEDLEGRATAAAKERARMWQKIARMDVAHTKLAAKWGWIQIAVTAAIGALVVAAVKALVGGG